MQILILSGSRNKQGKTAQAINAIAKGVSDAGGTSGVSFLIQHKIERCRQCEKDGWGICRKEGRCVIEDDFASIVEKINAADVVVFATPVYFGDLSESMRNFLERLRRIRFNKIARPPAPGMPGPLPTEQSTPAVGLCYAGGSGFGTISCAANLERILQGSGFDVVDMIPVRRQNLEAKLPILEITGKWLVTKPTSGPLFAPPSK